MAARGPRRYRKAKKAPRARKAGKKAHNMDTYRKSIKLTAVIIPAQGVTVSNYVYAFVGASPSGGVGNQTCGLTSAPEFALYNQMHDQFRVLGVSVRVVPRATVTDQVALTLNADNSTVSLGKQVFYTAEDRDGIAPGNIETLKKYSSVKVHKMTKPMSRSYRVKYDGPNTWFDCQSTPAYDQVQKALGLWGGLTLYGESFPERFGQVFNSVWADLEVSYDVVFRGKALINIAVAENGSVTLSQVALDVPDIQVFKSGEEIPHFGSIDLSGNTIGDITFVAP